jgi:carnitine O-acetyltransferase
VNSPLWSSRTFGNEDRLPRVPLPTLDESCDRFLEWCAPLLTAAQLAETEAAVAAFREPGGAGPILQTALEDYDASPGVRSWLDTFWSRRYLGRRDRIALNANFFFLLQDADLVGTSPQDRQIERAAGLIAAAVAYKLRLDVEEIPPIIQRGQALSMGQQKFLFSATRIPGVIQDTVRVPYSHEWPGPSRESFIVVFYQGTLHRMEVLGPEGQPYAVDDLMAGLRAITKSGITSTSPVGHLTTKARADWAASRQALLACAPDNAGALDTIERALFCVCLDDVTPTSTLEACDLLLHGNSGNRWFDKAISFIVFGGGLAGINGEHCGLDGTTMLAFIDTLMTTPVAALGRSQGLPLSGPIEFTLDDGLRADIAAAAASFADYADNTASTTVSFTDFGTERAKALRMSPDGFVQMAYQLAHRRSRGFVGATYESIATRHWQNGRTEAMRVVTPEVLRFVAAMDDPAMDAVIRRELFRAAVEKHIQRARECQAGKAPEQHLWELMLIHERRGEALGITETPALGQSPGWLVMRDDYLSTSSVPSTHIRYVGFGSTSNHCIGIAYVLLPDRLNLYLSTPRAVEEEMLAFADHLRVAVTELQDLLTS